MQQAFLFPGQGSQTVGMGAALAKAHAPARAVFAEVDEALGEPLSRIIWEGPAELLTRTANAQPALMAVSLAVLRVLEAGGLRLAEQVRYVAGHSLGEYSALAAAGALSVADAARLLRRRGGAMQDAVPEGEGAMAAILGLTPDEVAAVAREAATAEEICAPANDNAPGQIVLSGHKAAVERAMALAKEKGAKRALPLAVSAPFHCALMAPAQEAMRAALAETAFMRPCVPVIANVTARPMQTPEEIKARLVAQVTAPVRWRESMEFLADEGITQVAELGAGKVLGGLARRAHADWRCHSLGAPEELAAFLAEI